MTGSCVLDHTCLGLWWPSCKWELSRYWAPISRTTSAWEQSNLVVWRLEWGIFIYSGFLPVVSPSLFMLSIVSSLLTNLSKEPSTSLFTWFCRLKCRSKNYWALFLSSQSFLHLTYFIFRVLRWVRQFSAFLPQHRQLGYNCPVNFAFQHTVRLNGKHYCQNSGQDF